MDKVCGDGCDSGEGGADNMAASLAALLAILTRFGLD
eukprot:CAMPEP_0195305252 /NCGR_PEP_ID=MMETSP0707-20130614/35959_1 /TAXON_ID=33640 /ORGANISM="Asterionellopsis glacialis, Strain CCMP134" /LENGTH=36 /DNA_ID= /DNA_START= /DNA_END= /DNA_ORIENTATION=